MRRGELEPHVGEGSLRPASAADLQCIDAGSATADAPGEDRANDGIELPAVLRHDVLPRCEAGAPDWTSRGGISAWRVRTRVCDAPLGIPARTASAMRVCDMG